MWNLWLRRAAFGAAMAAMLGGGLSCAAAQTNLKVMVFPGVQNLPLFAAQAKGFFAKHGLEVEVLNAPNSQELRDGLAQGRHQIVHGGIDNAVAMAEVAKAEMIAMMAERLKLAPDVAAQSYAVAADPQSGLAKDAKLDLEGFRNVLKLRAELEGQWGGTPPSPEKYIDASYYDRALKGL